ncbi:hypothetical protein SAMN02799624_06299 [Paenibacillus sp. UNC496MF]|nr:hypothetical protein SAMN02799624_06299 [Paenibacillus sp. UNC496MF]
MKEAPAIGARQDSRERSREFFGAAREVSSDLHDADDPPW